MSQTQNIATYAIVGLLIGAVVGYMVAGPVSYNPQIKQLQDRISELEAGGGAALAACEDSLSDAQQEIADLEDDKSDLQAEVSALNEQIDELENPPLRGTLSVAGSTTVLPISQECATIFMEENSGVDISVAGGGSGHGVKSAGAGEVDIGEASRNVKASELLKYPDLVAFSVAKDSVAIVVNPDNPLASSIDLTTEQISEIFSGVITNWNELGGPNREINVYTREEGSGTRETFETFFMNDLEFADDAGVKPSNGEMRAAVAGDVDGIAYISLGYVDASVRSAKLDGVECNVANVLSGSYTAQRILWMFTKGMPDELEQAFINFVQSSDGQTIVEDLGFIAIH